MTSRKVIERSVSTSDDTAKEIYNFGAVSAAPECIRAYVRATDSSGTTEHVEAWEIAVFIGIKLGETGSRILYTTTTDQWGEGSGLDAGWLPSFAVNGSTELVLQVVGETATDIDWDATIEYAARPGE